ncbi:MAG: ABC transporter substrate-binding protein [Hydrogenophilus sp.]|nr:ABC transporter substrate-binding protein [Hydrogenophilus sp.]
MRKWLTHVVGWLGAVWVGIAAATGAAEDPVRMVQQLSDRVLAHLRTHPASDESGRAALVALVEQEVLPYFDMVRMTSLAVGPAWRQADAAQRERLVAEFRQLLVRTYTNAARSYRDERLEFLPQRSNPGDPVVRVAARLVRSGGEPLEIQYVVERRDGGWRIFDVVIGGVSLVTSYRSSFAAEISRSGVEGLIRTLAEKNARGEVEPAPGIRH